MKLTAFLATSVLLVSQAHALLRVPVSADTASFKRLAKKDFTSDTIMQNYIIPSTDFYVGSGHDKILISFDTGSYTSYIQSSSISDQGFDSNDSTSFVDLGTQYSVAYADGTSFTGEWSSDIVAFDSSYSISANLTFGYVTKASDLTNIFGLGYYPNNPNPNFIDTLFNQGIIEKRVFSVYQNTISDGEFSFGAVDTGKVSSAGLVKFPVIESQSWTVKLFNAFVGCETLTYGNSYNILIDSGSSTGLYMPHDVYTNLLNKYEAKFESTLNGYIFDCNNAKSLTIDFGDYQVEIPTSFFVQTVSGTDYCTVNWKVSSNDLFQLGWTFFSQFYFVFDADANELMIGRPTNEAENIVEISGDVPNAVQGSKYADTAVVATNAVPTTAIETVNIFQASSSLGDYYAAATGFTTCVADQSSSSSSSSYASSSYAASSSTTTSSSSSVAAAISSSSSVPTAATSSIAQSSSPAEATSSIAQSSSPAEATSSIAESSSPVEATSSNAGSTSPAEITSSSTFPTITPLSASPKPSSSSFSSFAGYSNSSLTLTSASSAIPSSVSSSSGSPTISGSFNNGSPIWDVTVPSTIGAWQSIEISSSGNNGLSFVAVDSFIDNQKVSPLTYQFSSSSFVYQFNNENTAGEFESKIQSGKVSSDSATISIQIVINFGNNKFSKRSTETFTLTSTVYAGAASSTSSIASGLSIGSSIGSSTASGSSIVPGSLSTQVLSSSIDTAKPQITSIVTQNDESTTLVTITSCSNDICSTVPTPVIVQTLTTTIGNVVEVYTTYCPLSGESSTSHDSTGTSTGTGATASVSSTETTKTGAQTSKETPAGSSTSSAAPNSSETTTLRTTTTVGTSVPTGSAPAGETTQPVGTQTEASTGSENQTSTETELRTETLSTATAPSLTTATNSNSNSNSNNNNNNNNTTSQTTYSLSEYEGIGSTQYINFLGLFSILVLVL